MKTSAKILLFIFTVLSPVVGVSEPHLLTKLSFGENGGRVVRFGDLIGDGQSEILTVQNRGQRITCITAYNLDGEVLWQHGRPNPNAHTAPWDLAIQLYDLNKNGRAEVIFIERTNRLTVLDGISGKRLRRRRVEPRHAFPRDALFIAPLLKGNRPALIIKNRYTQFWVLNERLRTVYTRRMSVGHFPTSARTGQRKAERLFIGFSAFDFQGRGAREAWKLPRDRDPYKWHNDAVSVGDLNGDGVPEVAIATSKESVLVNGRTGRLIWSKDTRHSQHANISTNFANFIDRGPRGRLLSFDYRGRLVFDRGQQGRVAMLSIVNGWDNSGDYLLVFRRDGMPPVLLSEDGTREVELPFPRFPHFAQHFDLSGDLREEILIYDHLGLYIYENNSDETSTLNQQLPQRRIYNASFYRG